MASALRQKQLVKSSPLVNAVQATVNSNPVEDIKNVNKRLSLEGSLVFW